MVAATEPKVGMIICITDVAVTARTAATKKEKSIMSSTPRWKLSATPFMLPSATSFARRVKMAVASVTEMRDWGTM